MTLRLELGLSLEEPGSGAVFSNDGLYRYSLLRRWGDGGICVFVMLNPSTADEIRDDPTVAKCGKYARKWGYGALIVVNVFAWRSTDPSVLPKAVEPIGPDNDLAIGDAVARSAIVVCAWGVHAGLNNRDRDVLALIRAAGVVPHALRVTKYGFAEHLLYLPGNLKPVPYLGRPETRA